MAVGSGRPCRGREVADDNELIVALGLALLVLTLYISTLAYTIRTFSRSRLSVRLANGSREPWLVWLDEHEWELQTLLSLLRIAVNLSWLILAWKWFTVDLQRGASLRTGIEASLLALVLLSIFAIGVPHALAVHSGEAILARSLGLLAVLRTLFWPFGRLFDAIEFVVRRLLGKPETTEEQESERVEQEILDAVSEGKAHGAVDEDQEDMIESVFALDETAVSAIMTPRTDIDAVPINATYEDVRKMILESGHSRIPVYEGTVDHIVGVVYAKDLLRLDAPDGFETGQSMRAVPYVPESKTLDELLEEFRQSQVQIAIVLDEYGGTAGLVTLEDILEELVGEIADEYDEQPPEEMTRIDQDTLEVDARVHIHEINEELETSLPEEEDYDTIGGYVFATLGKIPATGEEFKSGQVRIQIIDAEPRRIKRLRIQALREPTLESA